MRRAMRRIKENKLGDRRGEEQAEETGKRV